MTNNLDIKDILSIFAEKLISNLNKNMKHIIIGFLLFVNLMVSAWVNENITPSLGNYIYLILSIVVFTLYLLRFTKASNNKEIEWHDPYNKEKTKANVITPTVYDNINKDRERIQKIETAFTNRITPYVSEEIERAKIFGQDSVTIKVKPYLFPYPNMTDKEMSLVEQLMENEIRQTFNLPYVKTNLNNYLLTISGITENLE